MDKVLVLDQPAKVWEDASPLGNGSLGAMVYGGVHHEIIGLNEETFWSGKPLEDDDYDVTEHLNEARKLIDKQHYHKAHKFVNDKLVKTHWTQNYLPLGQVEISLGTKGRYEDYRRELNMTKGMLTVDYQVDNVKYHRESFCSHIDQVCVLHLEADSPKALGCEIKLDSLIRHEVFAEGKALAMEAEAPVHTDPVYDQSDEPIRYGDKGEGIHATTLVYIDTDGELEVTDKGTLLIKSGQNATLYMTAKTNFVDENTKPCNSNIKTKELCQEILAKATAKGYNQLKEDHIADFQDLMNRVEVHFDHEPFIFNRRRDEMVKEPWDEKFDVGIAEALFDFGRYLIISGSREGTQPTNLQGIWNGEMCPAWCSNYTININTQMNYWPVDVTNLTECFEPLYRLTRELSQKGDVPARALGCKGWTAHHNTDLWRQTVPVSGDAQYSFWPFSGPWFMIQLFDHYEFTRDLNYLKEIYPLMKGAAEFCIDWLYEEEGVLHTSPSMSPENSFYDLLNRKCCITKSSTMDHSIIWELLTSCLKAMKALDLEEEESQWGNLLVSTRDKLCPLQLTKDGRIMEYAIEHREREKDHRHVSHLFGMYPGNRMKGQDKFIEGCHKSLMTRLKHGGGQTSWSCSWYTLLFARLRDGHMCGKMLNKFQSRSLLTNGFSTHPPFQIDGNYGITSAIAEMLIQSDEESITLLPALPEKFKTGYFKGLRCRGDFTVNAQWEDGKLNTLEIYGKKGATTTLYISGDVINVSFEEEGIKTLL